MIATWVTKGPLFRFCFLRFWDGFSEVGHSRWCGWLRFCLTISFCSFFSFAMHCCYGQTDNQECKSTWKTIDSCLWEEVRNSNQTKESSSEQTPIQKCNQWHRCVEPDVYHINVWVHCMFPLNKHRSRWAHIRPHRSLDLSPTKNPQYWDLPGDLSHPRLT